MNRVLCPNFNFPRKIRLDFRELYKLKTSNISFKTFNTNESSTAYDEAFLTRFVGRLLFQISSAI